jgi:RNA polymerase sigma-70 factor (ECF subfamily)
MADLARRHGLIEEAELLQRALGRDGAAIRLIIQQHNQRLYRIARSILRDDNEAEDVLQDAYCRAFSQLGSFRGEARFGTWLARIVVNEALGRRRLARPTVELDDAVETQCLAAQIIPFPNASFQADPETAAAQHQIQILLERAIDALPEVFRMILVTRVIEGMSVEETAALFDIPPETVKTRLHRARRLLKRELERQIGPVLGGVFPFGGHRCNRLTEIVLAHLGLL